MVSRGGRDKTKQPRPRRRTRRRHQDPGQALIVGQRPTMQDQDRYQDDIVDLVLDGICNTSKR